MWCIGLASLVIAGAFSFEDDGKSLQVLEDGHPVLVYQYQPGETPRFVSERYLRSGYIHPLFGLDGEVMTQDFPIDHFHHRGVFWAWPDSTLGERKIDVWALDGARQVHSEWVERNADDTRAEVAVVNHWVYDDAPDVPVIREEIRFIVRPQTLNRRSIDFELTFTNLAEEEFVLRGSDTEGKGYGGFCFRPDAMRRPLVFTSPQGVSAEDALELDAPWVDVSYATSQDGDTVSGVAIFQHPENPGFPHPGWILRHYGFLGQSWPHSQEHAMAPGDAFTLRYRLLIHRSNAEAGGVAAAFEQWLEECGMKVGDNE